MMESCHNIIIHLFLETEFRPHLFKDDELTSRKKSNIMDVFVQKKSPPSIHLPFV